VVIASRDGGYGFVTVMRAATPRGAEPAPNLYGARMTEAEFGGMMGVA